MKYNLSLTYPNTLHQTFFCFKEIAVVIAAAEERLPILLGIAGDCGDEARLEPGNCKDKG